VRRNWQTSDGPESCEGPTESQTGALSLADKFARQTPQPWGRRRTAYKLYLGTELFCATKAEILAKGRPARERGKPVMRSIIFPPDTKPRPISSRFYSQSGLRTDKSSGWAADFFDPISLMPTVLRIHVRQIRINHEMMGRFKKANPRDGTCLLVFHHYSMLQVDLK